jgi:hypothetical protein
MFILEILQKYANIVVFGPPTSQKKDVASAASFETFAQFHAFFCTFYTESVVCPFDGCNLLSVARYLEFLGFHSISPPP